MDLPPADKGLEWPTLGLAGVIYAMWFSSTYFYADIPLWALALIGAWTVAWQMSLQHEIIHGHPTRTRWINHLIAQWPLALWLPFESYLHSHLAHHNDERLTDPLDDPESFYWLPEQWAAIGRLGRALVRAQSRLVGRLVLGPAWTMIRFWRFEIAALIANRGAARRRVGAHIAQALAVLVWVLGICRMPLAIYILCYVYCGTAMALLRSFAEHRAESQVERRTAIVENAWILGPLFLFNNLHVAHHMRRNLAWYRLPAWYRANRDALVEINGGLVYDSYFDVVRRYFWRSHDQPLHPREIRSGPSVVEAPTPTS